MKNNIKEKEECNIKKILNNVKILSPEEAMEKCKSFFTKDRKNIFILSIIFGLITHFLLLSSLINSQDGLMHILHYSAGGYEASLGRWGIDLFDSLRNNIAIPLITTLISIVILSFSNIMLIELFDLKNKVFKILTVLIFVVSPSLCLTLLYSYTADVYFWSMFLAIFCVYALYKFNNKKIGYVLSGISFILMLSSYQSYIGFTIGLIVMVNIKKLLRNDYEKILDVLKDLVFKAILLVGFAIIYYLITIVLLKILNLEMTTYGGVNEITLLSIFTSLFGSIKNAYLCFVKYYFADGIILNRTWNRDTLYVIFYLLFIVSYVVLYLFKFINNKRKVNIKYIVNFIFTTSLIILLPLFLNIVLIIAPGNELYFLTSTQMVLMIPFIFVMLETINLINENIFVKLINWGSVITIFVIIVTYLFSIIVTYQTLELSYNQAKATAVRILEKIEDFPGYRKDMNYLIAGVIDDVNSPKTLDIYNYSLTNTLKSSLFHATYWGQEKTWKNFMNVYTGVHMNFCSDYEYYMIIHSDEFKEMDIFPGENSVKMINDVMVVKFTETPDLPPYSQNLFDHGINYEINEIK